ncbi:12894_t:CDS:2 [Dentiscutata erythropus]|uniref:12894_t:CDS:1 n=1 Tax=Dentiscutata erythropus TaxID=1348616 RepID=A0A9N9NVC4_9GLOM|nr:12894_t:CDS:2 [Dentiscutata erythropus]
MSLLHYTLLPPFPLETVFEILKHADNKTLLTCLVLNHKWFQTIAQILWRDPNFKSIKTIETLIAGLNSDEKLLFPYEPKNNGLWFHYPIFITEVSIDIVEGIKKWMLFNLGEINSVKFLKIMATLSIMILRTSQNLRRLVFGGSGLVLDDQLSELRDALFAAIENNRTLTSLSVMAFSHVLEINNTLTKLDVPGNYIGPNGVESLSYETLNPLVDVLKNTSTPH